MMPHMPPLSPVEVGPPPWNPMTLPPEVRITDSITHVGPLETYRSWIAENDALIRSSQLDNGRAIATTRANIHTMLAAHWAKSQVEALEYDRPFALVALGGTGRGEMAPGSDTDFAFLFEDAIEGNVFLQKLQRQTIHTDEFRSTFGFDCIALPFNLDDIPTLAEKQLNSFVDMRAIYDPQDLTARFRKRIQATFDPFAHFLYLRTFWKSHWEAATAATERLDRFDIKNDGLRVFLSAIWTLASQGFLHSHEIYETLDDPRDLAAYEFLLRIRSWIHLTRGRCGRPDAFGNHPEDILGFEHFVSFGDMLDEGYTERERFEYANEVRARLLSARRRIASFAKGVIERELRRGRHVSPGNPIVFGAGGLYHSTSGECSTPREKSGAALSLLLASQHYGVMLDPSELQSTFRNAGDWLVRLPEVSGLFYEQKGSLADSFAFLSHVDGAEERLFPGYGKFESSVDGRVMTERICLRGPLERQKMRALEHFVREGRERLAAATSQEKLMDLEQGVSIAVEAALLDADHLAGVKLALKTKRLPNNAEDEDARRDESRPLQERFTSGFSGIPLSSYYRSIAAECDFTEETIRTAEFLAANRRAFKTRSEAGINDTQRVEQFAQLCGDAQKLRALFVFTAADRAEWESEMTEPARWFNIRELYIKTMMSFQPARPDVTRTLKAAGFGSSEQSVLRDFGDDFFSGIYRRFANRFGMHLVQLADDTSEIGPKAALIRDGASTIIGVASRDYRGLAATITGLFWRQHIGLRQAHLFSAANHGLALDFFHIHANGKPIPPEMPRLVEDAISRRLHIGDPDEAILPRLAGRLSLQESRLDLFCLQFETALDTNGLVYALTYKIFRHLHGHIFGLNARSGKNSAYITVHHTLPKWLGLDQAQALVQEHF